MNPSSDIDMYRTVADTASPFLVSKRLNERNKPAPRLRIDSIDAPSLTGRCVRVGSIVWTIAVAFTGAAITVRPPDVAWRNCQCRASRQLFALLLVAIEVFLIAKNVGAAG
jgi:hypothetical protein